MLWHASIVYSFSLLTSITLYGYITVVYLSDAHLGCFRFLAIINTVLWTFMCEYLCRHMLYFHGGKECDDWITEVSISLTFKETVQAVFQSWKQTTFSPLPPECLSVLVIPHPPKHLAFSVSFFFFFFKF